MAEGTARLLISCPDRRGIIAAVTGFISDHEGNILDLDQHSDPTHRQFFMRVEVEPNGFLLNEKTFEAEWSPLADRFHMQWTMHWGHQIKRMVILVSREGHCLTDLLWRWKTRELRVDIPFIAGNHADLADPVAAFGIPFRHLPVSKETKASQEAELLRLLTDARADFVVLARYMQILSSQFVARYPARLINIHHGFLPAFAGSRAYHQAYERGVKIIGATSHYVTDELDEGPIIAQATLPVDHRDDVDDLIRKGRDLERVVLATAVRQHVEDKILMSKNKTIVFG
jgi:formyltetrahydrofolate deformylase